MIGRGGIRQRVVFGSTAPGGSESPGHRRVLARRRDTLHGRRTIDIGEARLLHGIQMVQVAPVLFEAVRRRQGVRVVTQVVLAELPGVVAEVTQKH